MNIKIKKLELTNFKCFRHKEFSFDSNITTIRGRNGVGKTTIADAILWCLFGKNAQGQADFDLKTHDDEGRAIPHLDHSVELVLSVVTESQPREITLKRTLKETWVKKRASEEQVFKNNTTEYLVNGEVITASDYKKYIAQLIDEDVFRAITNPSYFPSLKWQQQREFLTQMAGDITPDTSNADFAELLKYLTDSNEDIIAYRKHLSYHIRQVKDKLDKIPVRLEEQNKALPELLDWEALSVQSAAVSQQLSELDAKILQIKSGNGSDVRKEQLRSTLDALHNKKNAREDALRKPLYDQRMANTNAIADATSQFNRLLTNQRDIEAAIRSFDTLSDRCRETLTQCERDAEQIRKEWAENLSRTISWSGDDDFCPTCGQPLPQDQLRERQQQAIERLNQSKADTKAMLTDRANKVKALRSQAEEQIKDYAASKEEAEKNLAKTKQDINEVFAKKQDLEKVVIPTIEEALASDEDHQSILRQIAETKEALENASVTTEEDQQVLASLESKKVDYAATQSQLQSQLATRTQYDRIQSFIEAINNEQKDLIRQLSDLERREDIARQYQDRQNAILEERINQRFSIVKWRMFRTVNNGGDPFDEPFCECYVNGVAYHDGLNQAARLNAGLDICNVLCKHYNVSAPIIIDNSESSLNILETVGQQLRLEVFDSDLQIV